MRPRTLICGILLVFVAFLLYVLLGVLLPPLKHAPVEPELLDVGKEFETQGGEPERVRCIEENEDALIWRLRLMESAEKELVLTTFDFGDDNSGRDIMAAMYRAAERGVHVRLMIDGINGFLKVSRSPYFHALADHPNVEAKFYNPVNLLKPWMLNYRMHDKYVIADDTAYILGGRNTNDLFLGNYRKHYNIDRDMLVYAGENGASMQELRAYFEEIWELPTNKTVKYRKGEKEQAAEKELLQRYERLMEQSPELESVPDWKAETMETSGVKLLTNPMEAVNKKPEMLEQLYPVMKQGEEVLVETPYIICSDDMYQALTELGEGRKLEILVNAVESGANPFGCTDYLNQKNTILATGASVYESIYGQSLHRKTVLVDDRISLVGSYNLDMRSTYLDTELMLMIDSPKLNAQLRKAADTVKERSLHILPDGTETPGEDYEPVELDGRKKGVYRFLRTVIPLFRQIL